MKPVIQKLCNHCNKEFELKDVEHNGMLKASIANFENCPHCGNRNDHWIKVEWPKAETEAEFLESHVCEINRAFDGTTCLVCNEQIS